MELDFGLGSVYNWVFHVADVTTPILGIDFLAACKFNINVHNASITDRCTKSSIRANTISIKNVTHITSIIPSSDYLQLLTNSLLFYLKNPFSHRNITWYIASVLQEGQSTAGPDISALTSPPQSSLPSRSCSSTALSRSAAHLGAALFIAY